MPDVTANQPFNPLDERVNEKSYAQGANNHFSQSEMNSDLGEPSYNPPPDDDFEIPSSEEKKVKKDEKPAPPKPFNPSMADVPEGEKFERAKQMGDNLMMMFEKMHEMGNELLKISDKNIRKRVAAGELDMEMTVPFEIGSEVTFREFVQEYNNQCNDVHKVTPEFKKALMPSVYAELAKHGHGMSNGQNIVFLLTQHMFQQGFKHYQMRMTTKSVFDFAKEMKELEASNRQQRVPAYQQAPAAVVEQQPVQQQQVYEAPVVDINSLPLQERVLANHQAAINGGGQPGAILPDFGNEKKIKGINKIIAKDVKDQERTRKATSRITAAKKQASINSDPPPGGEKKKRGPKIGSKRTPKK